PLSLLLFGESVLVAILCRPGQVVSPGIFHIELLSVQLFTWTRITQSGLLAFIIAAGILVARQVIRPQPTENGLLWALVAGFAGLQSGGASRLGSAYFATGGLILAASLVENSYLLAYQDELTSLPGRRAFNEALPLLQAPYTVAAVDIDHFKSFN